MLKTSSASHSVFSCTYHLVFCPKCRQKVLYGQLAASLMEVFKLCASELDCAVLDGHILSDHVHLLLFIPPKYAVSEIVGKLKGKSAYIVSHRLQIAAQNARTGSLWQKGYFVSTIGHDAAQVAEYIRTQTE